MSDETRLDEAKEIIDLIENRNTAQGKIEDRPLSYIAGGAFIKSQRLYTTALGIMNESVHGDPKNSFLKPSDIDTLQDTVAYCLEILARNKALINKDNF